MLSRRMFTGCAICAAIGFVADDGSAQADKIGFRRTIISQRDGPVDGYEVLEAIIDIEPNFVVDWHTHPGTEAVYTMEGGGELFVKGEATQQTKPGVSYVIASDTAHSLRNGPSATKLLAVFNVQKGKPLVTKVPAPT